MKGRTVHRLCGVTARNSGSVAVFREGASSRRPEHHHQSTELRANFNRSVLQAPEQCLIMTSFWYKDNRAINLKKSWNLKSSDDESRQGGFNFLLKSDICAEM